MAAKEIPQGGIIQQGGQPLAALHVISRGTVRVSYPGGDFYLGKGDVIGLCEIDFDSHFLTYTAAEPSVLITFPCKMGQLGDFLEKHSDFSGLLTTSSLKQAREILDLYELMKFDCDNFYHFLMNSYSEYVALCKRHHISARALPGMETVEPLVLEEDIEDWLGGYYEGLSKNMTAFGNSMIAEKGFLEGLLLKTSQDVHSVISVCRTMYDYKSDISNLLLNENGLDFFDLYTSMYFRIGPNTEDSTAVGAAVSKMMIELESQNSTDRDLYQKRVTEYRGRLQSMDQMIEVPEKQPGELVNAASLSGSLETILEYSGCGEEVTVPFRQAIGEYKELVDKNSTDDSVRKIRLTITKLFYQLYESAFQISLMNKEIPPVVKMFFNFGYVDEDLAGMENASYLYSIVDKLPSDPSRNVYTIYEWLRAIYDGRKDPSRNEFDNDFLEYVHELKVTGKINAQAEVRMQQDKAQRVMYEIQNMFPLVNKVSFGRITTFCPVFSEHNVLKPLNTTLVSADKLLTALDTIRACDFSAFYRDTVYSEPEKGITKEYVSVEILPDFILMPNIGIRGVMWQEIEGRRRTTPSRMMFSLFHMEDLTGTLVRLTGEFRWEMCRRIQGIRWNDLTERSLTSEYFDYIQFYRKNHDLSADAKDKIKAGMQKAKNSYKEMFINDYRSWILFEAAGSPRLNKVARNIIFTYCPFTREVRGKLRANPLYRELMDRYDIRLSSKLHHMNNLCQKLKSSGQPIPSEISNQVLYLQK